MKSTGNPAKPDGNPPRTETESLAALSRLKLARLDVHTCEDNYSFTCEGQGYDPYDTAKGRARDVWSTKRKRA
jgi:hypothetical protein